MSSHAAIRVLIADDHPVVCFGLAAIIKSQKDMLVVGHAENGQEAVRMFREFVPNVTLMDLRMPGMGGVDAIRTIRSEYNQAAIIVLTTYRGDEDIHGAIEAGARGYILKGMPHTQLVDAIRTVHAGLRYLPAPVLESLANRAPYSELSGRELEVLRLMVKGLSNRQIADALGITEGTVKWHVTSILSSMNVGDRTQAVIAALQRGLAEL